MKASHRTVNRKVKVYISRMASEKNSQCEVFIKANIKSFIHPIRKANNHDQAVQHKQEVWWVYQAVPLSPP